MRNVWQMGSMDFWLTGRSYRKDQKSSMRLDSWGIKVESVELRDIILPDDMRR